MSLEEKIKEWISKQGYPLEMKVAKAFQSKGFQVKLSSYYEDQESKSFREIDVIATKSILVNKVIFDLNFVIECKYSPEKPWLIFKSQSDTDYEKKDELTFRVTSEAGAVALLALSINDEIKENKIFRIAKNLGYGVTRALENQKDMPYKAMLSACKASVAMAKDVDDSWNKSRVYSADIFFPVIVVDGKLFACSLGNDSEIELEETMSETIIFRNPGIGSQHTLVDIVSIDILDEYVETLCAAIDDVFKVFEFKCDGFFKYVDKRNSES